MHESVTPRKNTRVVLESMSISLLVAHLRTHEEYARLKLSTKSEYDDYYANYLELVYNIGKQKDRDRFGHEILIGRIDRIPFKHKVIKGKERLKINSQGEYIYEYNSEVASKKEA